MIVDDCESFRIVLSEILGSETVIKIVAMASNGKEAVDKALLLKPDVILMDIQMPIMNGFEATKTIKESLPAVAIIGLSNATDPSIEKKMKDYGASSLLLKGVSSEQIVNEITKFYRIFKEYKVSKEKVSLPKSPFLLSKAEELRRTRSLKLKNERA